MQKIGEITVSSYEIGSIRMKLLETIELVEKLKERHKDIKDFVSLEEKLLDIKANIGQLGKHPEEEEKRERKPSLVKRSLPPIPQSGNSSNSSLTVPPATTNNHQPQPVPPLGLPISAPPSNLPQNNNVSTNYKKKLLASSEKSLRMNQTIPPPSRQQPAPPLKKKVPILSPRGKEESSASREHAVPPVVSANPIETVKSPRAESPSFPPAKKLPSVPSKPVSLNTGGNTSGSAIRTSSYSPTSARKFEAPSTNLRKFESPPPTPTRSPNSSGNSKLLQSFISTPTHPENDSNNDSAAVSDAPPSNAPAGSGFAPTKPLPTIPSSVSTDSLASQHSPAPSTSPSSTFIQSPTTPFEIPNSRSIDSLVSFPFYLPLFLPYGN